MVVRGTGDRMTFKVTLKVRGVYFGLLFRTPRYQHKVINVIGAEQCIAA